MTNKKNVLNIVGIVLFTMIMLGVIIGYSLFTGLHYFGFFSLMKVLTYGATMFFLYSVLSKKNIKGAATTLISLFFISGVVPVLARIKVLISTLLGTIKGNEIPEQALSQLKGPASVLLIFQTLFLVILILLFCLSLYAIFKNKKYSSKEIALLFLLIGVAFVTIEILENMYFFISVLGIKFIKGILIVKTPIMVFEYFILVYLANDLKNSRLINLFYYIVIFAYTVVVNSNSIIKALSSSPDYVYVIFLMVSSILVYFYCTIISYLIFKD